MKKPTPAKGKSGDGEKLKIKELEVAKELAKGGVEIVKLGGKFADLGKQVQITKAAVSQSSAKIEEAREKTRQTAIDAYARIEETRRLRQQETDKHKVEMAELQLRYEQMTSLNRDRERVLDRVLEETADTELLMQSYCALIPPSKS